MSKRNLLVAGILIVLLIALPLTLFLVKQQQDVRSRAQTPPTPIGPTPGASCAAPTQVQNVKVDYPSCDGANCSFAQASCSWDQSQDAVSYNVKVTEVESSTIIKNEIDPVSTTKIVFNITQGKTYKCDVSAVNSCGATGPAGTHSQLCANNAGITPFPTLTITPTPAGTTPTIAPTATPSATPTLAPTATPTATLVPSITPTPTPVLIAVSPTLRPGDIKPIVVGGAGIAIAIFGGLLFLLFGL